METNVIEYFKSIQELVEIQNVELDLLKYIFGSPTKLFGVAIINNQELLESNWKQISDEFATRIQSRLIGDLHNLKWDMYLVFVMEKEVTNLKIMKTIENNRMFFKKIVINKNEKDFRSLLSIELTLDSDEKLEVFSENQYLDVLYAEISDEVRNKIDLKLFKDRSINTVNDEVFIKPYEEKGGKN